MPGGSGAGLRDAVRSVAVQLVERSVPVGGVGRGGRWCRGRCERAGRRDLKKGVLLEKVNIKTNTPRSRLSAGVSPWTIPVRRNYFGGSR